MEAQQPKTMGQSKSILKRVVYSDISLSQETTRDTKMTVLSYQLWWGHITMQ